MIPMSARDRQRRRKEEQRKRQEARRQEEERQRQLRLKGGATSASAAPASASGRASGGAAASSSRSSSSSAYRSSSAARTGIGSAAGTSSASRTVEEIRTARHRKILEQREEEEKRKRQAQIKERFLKQHPEMAHCFEESPLKPPKIPRPTVRSRDRSSSPEAPMSRAAAGRGTAKAAAKASASAAGGTISRKKGGGWTSKSDFGGSNSRGTTRDREHSTSRTATAGKSRSREATSTGVSSSTTRALSGRGGKVPMEVDLSGGSKSSSASGGGREDRYSSRMDEPSPLDDLSLSPPASPGKKRKMTKASSCAVDRPAYSSAYSGAGAGAGAVSSTRKYDAASSYSGPSSSAQKKNVSSLPSSRRYYEESSDSDELYAYARAGDEARRRKKEAEEAAAAAAAEEARKKNKKRRSYSDSSSSEDDEEETGRGNDNKKMSSSAANKRTSKSSNDQSDSDSDFNEHLAKMKRDQEANRPHNPLALQKMEEEKYASLARAKSAKLQDHRRRAPKKKGTSGDESDDDDSIVDAGGAAKAAAAKLDDDDDGFFSDAEQREADVGNDSSDCDRKKKKRVKAKSTPRGVKRGASSSSSGSREKSAGARSKASSSSNAAKKKSPAKKKSKTEDEDDKAKYDADMEELSDEDEDLENRLKPNFANPKFAVGALEPLKMTVTNFGKGHKCVIESDMEMTRHYVPSSINRYLQPYQREGIQFMHKIITDQSIPRGCILGDDMGLGKTVQVIGLLAAIQKKGGNDLDLKLLQQKGRRIAEELEAMQKREEDALLQGLPIPQSNKDEIYADARKSGRILVIVPASVVANWQNELKAWGHFSVAVYEGQNRRDALDRVREGRDEILVIGKPLFTKKGTDFPQINELDWRLVICDEMHEYKGHRTNGHKCLEELRNKSKCPVIGLTGTLIQNNYEELHTLVTLVQPGLIGDRKTFMDQTGKPLMNMRSKTATAAVIARGEKRKAELDKAMEMVYLHRKKIDVLKDDLTEKMQRVIFCELSDLQKRLYRHVLTLPDYHLLRTANTPCDCGVNQAFFLEFRRLKTTKEKLEYQRRKQKEVVLRKRHCYQIPHNPDRFDPDEPPIDPRAAIWSSQHDGAEPCDKCPSCVFLPALTKLYKICSHPSLLQADQDLSKLPKGSAEYDKTKKVLDFAKVAIPPGVLAKLPGGSYVRDASLMDDHLSLSGKMEVLDYCLHKFNQRSDRVLIFSYSTKTLDLIENCVKAHGYRFLRLDGSTSTRKRQTLVDKFQNDDSFKAFLISTKAGGLGLNLTAANKVIIFDVNWNPSYDEQAQDRAFRIGQQRDVEVIRLVSQGTVEELMYARQLYKVHLKQQALGGKDKEEEAARLFRGVVGDKNRKGELFGIENLLKFKDGSFMDDIWSSRKGKKGKHAAANEEDIASALSNAGGVDGVLNMGGTDEAEVQMLEEAAASENRRMSKGVNHEDFLSKHHGGAAIDQDDEGFEEEMGGASQMNYAVYEEGGEEVDTDEEEEKKEEEDEDEKKPAAKLSPIAEQRIKDDPDIEEVQSTRSPHQRDTGLGSAGTKDVTASSPVAATTAATFSASAAPANAAASTWDSSKKKAGRSRPEREVNASEASGAAVRSEPVAPEPMDEESPVAEVAASIMIINDAKRASKKKGGSPSKLSGLLHKPSYKKKKKKKKKKDP